MGSTPMEGNEARPPPLKRPRKGGGCQGVEQGRGAERYRRQSVHVVCDAECRQGRLAAERQMASWHQRTPPGGTGSEAFDSP